jgi:putative DNA primase/helicase
MAGGRINEVELAAMIESGALEPRSEVGAADWLMTPPDHVRRAQLGIQGQPVAPTPKPPHAPGMLLTPPELLAAPTTPYLVRGLLPARGLAAIYGESGSGKSFLAIDLALALATGHSHWFGYRLKHAPVAYMALEGQGGIKRRVQAWAAHAGLELPGAARFYIDEFSILDPGIADRIAAEVFRQLGPGSVIFIDTMNQAAAGADENTSADMGMIIRNAKGMGEHTQGLVILIHHAGKNLARGMRGHSSLFAAMDAVLEVAHDQDVRSFRAAKVKDDDAGATRYFRLKSYTVDRDSDGDDVRSCAVVPDAQAPTPKLRPITGKNRLAVVAALRAAGSVSWAQALGTAAAALSAPIGRRNSIAKATLEGLISSGHLRLDNGAICLAC